MQMQMHMYESAHVKRPALDLADTCEGAFFRSDKAPTKIPGAGLSQNCQAHEGADEVSSNQKRDNAEAIRGEEPAVTTALSIKPLLNTREGAWKG